MALFPIQPELVDNRLCTVHKCQRVRYVEMEEYESHRLRSIFGKQVKMRELDANLLKQGVRRIECRGDNVRVVLKNNQALEERDQV